MKYACPYEHIQVFLEECLCACQKSRITFTCERVSKESVLLEEEEMERAWVFPAFPCFVLCFAVLCCVVFAFAL